MPISQVCGGQGGSGSGLQGARTKTTLLRTFPPGWFLRCGMEAFLPLQPPHEGFSAWRRAVDAVGWVTSFRSLL